MLVLLDLLQPFPDEAETVYVVVEVGFAVIVAFAVEGVPAPTGNPAVPEGVAVQLYK